MITVKRNMIRMKSRLERWRALENYKRIHKKRRSKKMRYNNNKKKKVMTQLNPYMEDSMGKPKSCLAKMTIMRSSNIGVNKVLRTMIKVPRNKLPNYRKC